MILDVKQLNNIMKLYYFYTLKALLDGQGKMRMYYGMSRVKKHLSGKISVVGGPKVQPENIFGYSSKTIFKIF